MNNSLKLIFVLPVLLSAAHSQSSSSSEPTEALQVLRQVTRAYAELNTYYIEATERQVIAEEYSGGWIKQTVIAAKASGNRFRFEVNTGIGSESIIADGRTVWMRQSNERKPTSIPEPTQGADISKLVANQSLLIRQAASLRQSISELGVSATRASFLPDDTLVLDDQFVKCRVILLHDVRDPRFSPDTLFDVSVWIDQVQKRILKISEHGEQIAKGRGATQTIEVSITYRTVFEDVPDCLFTIRPAEYALDDSGSTKGFFSLEGKKLPSLTLVSPDGSSIRSQSFLGRPLLIDFWATWCSPCVAELPDLDQLYRKTRGKGLNVVTVDQDSEPDKGSAFLSRKGYTWPNFSDPGGAIHKQLGRYNGIPRMLLVSADGIVLYDGTGADQTKLHLAIANLGPDFEEFAPGAKYPACIVPRR